MLWPEKWSVLIWFQDISFILCILLFIADYILSIVADSICTCKFDDLSEIFDVLFTESF